MPGTFLSTLYKLAHLILIVEETEAKIGSATCTKLPITLSDRGGIQTWQSDASAHATTNSILPLHTFSEDILN